MAAAQPLSPPAWRDCPCSPAQAEQPSTSSQGFAAAQAAAEAPPQQPQHRRQTPPPVPQPPPQFGLEYWIQKRKEWLRRGTEHPRAPPNRRPTIDIDATYEELLSTNRRFDTPIPLLEMVDFLGDCWTQDGLYD